MRRALARFQVPNELIQQAAGQRQDGNNFETMGTVSYTHIFSSDVLADVRGMIRDDSKGLTSNPLSTPVMAFSNNGFREGYFKASISIHHGRHEWKAQNPFLAGAGRVNECKCLITTVRIDA